MLLDSVDIALNPVTGITQTSGECRRVLMTSNPAEVLPSVQRDVAGARIAPKLCIQDQFALGHALCRLCPQLVYLLAGFT
jgi:hypothetical protein